MSTATKTAPTETSRTIDTFIKMTYPRLHLLGLLRELRDEIWKGLVFHNSTISLNLSTRRSRKTRDTIVVNLANQTDFDYCERDIFKVNHQIADEVGQLYYGTNTFRIEVKLEVQEQCREHVVWLEYGALLQENEFLQLEWNLSRAFAGVRKVVLDVGSLMWEDQRTYRAGREFMRQFVEACGGVRNNLETLEVEYWDEDGEPAWDGTHLFNCDFWARKPQKYTPYLLEPLAGLGHVPLLRTINFPEEHGFRSFGRKLKKVVKAGVGGLMEKRSYENVASKRKGLGKRKGRSSKKYFDPELEWGWVTEITAEEEMGVNVDGEDRMEEDPSEEQMKDTEMSEDAL